MDLVKLLSRGTKTSKKSSKDQFIPSELPARPQSLQTENRGKKRKRAETDHTQKGLSADANEDDVQSATNIQQRHDTEECRALLKRHKIKVTNLSLQKEQSKKSFTQADKKQQKRQSQIYPYPCLTFEQLSARTDIPSWLRSNLDNEGYSETTEVQMAALPLLLDTTNHTDHVDAIQNQIKYGSIDLLTIAPTGSGKTLAFLVPLLAKIASAAGSHNQHERTYKAIILAPTRELVEQTANIGRRLTAGSDTEVVQYRRGMQLSKKGSTSTKPTILVSTPGVLQSAINQDSSIEQSLSSVQSLILDEADVLLDTLFREQTVDIWRALERDDLHVSMWSATMGSNIESLVESTIEQRSDYLLEQGKHAVRRPLVRLVVGLKDSAVPNVQHKLIYAATERGKLMGLRQLLHPASSSGESSSLRPPFIIFTQTIERAIALHSELLYDIPVEAGGISRIAVLHSDLSDSARDNVMARFRKAEIWVLITTDLLSRGIDFRGVNGVVNYDIPSSSAAYVHRIGRTGRAGREGGVAVTLYAEEDIPYLKHIANVVAVAQQNSDTPDQSDVQQWLLAALPSLNKNSKQKLKKHGVESRTARGAANDPKAARRNRISTKAGYLRREENNRRGAVEASRRRAQEVHERDESDADFDGFKA